MHNNNIKTVKKIIGRNLIGCTLFFLLCSLIGLLTLVEPLFLSKLITLATNGELIEKYYLIIVVLCLFIARIGLGYIKNYWLYLYRNKCIEKISCSMFEHLTQVQMNAFDKLSSSYLATRIIDEPMNIDGVLDYFLIDGCVSLLICLGLICMMAFQSVILAVLVIFFVLLDYIISMKLPLTKIYASWNETQARLKSDMVDTINGVKVIKIGNSYESEKGRYENNIRLALKTLLSKCMTSHVQRTTGVVCRQIGYLSLIAISAVLISINQLDLGGFTLLISLYSLLNANISTAENIIPLYKYGKTTSDRIIDILSIEKEDLDSSEEIPEKVYSVDFKNISFAYQSSKYVLNDINFQAQSGQITTFAGYSGCGKSTILNLIMGFMPCNKGEIIINGETVTISQLISLRKHIGYVGQGSILFNRSLKENLFYYVEENNINQKRLDRLLKHFSLDTLIASLPQGINSVLGEDSCMVSSGERQRLCIIRELMKSPQILLLDEFTAHLDAAKEKEIFHLLRDVCNEIVIIQVAHRESALSNSDKIYLLDAGEIIGQGSHFELLSSSPFYKRLLATYKE